MRAFSSAATQFVGSYDASRIGFYSGGWQMFASNTGHIEIGSTDTYLYRGGAANLFVENTIRANGSIVIGQNGAQAYMYFGSALDTFLYRRSAGSLQMNGNFFADGDLFSHYGANHHFETTGARGVAEIRLGPYGDISLYRESANVINHYSTLGSMGYAQSGSI